MTTNPHDLDNFLAELEQGGRVCERCANIFSPKRYWQRFCSIDCRTTFNNRVAQKRPPHAPKSKLEDLI